MLTGKKVGPNKKKHQRRKKHEWGQQTVAAVDSLQLTCWDLLIIGAHEYVSGLSTVQTHVRSHNMTGWEHKHLWSRHWRIYSIQTVENLSFFGGGAGLYFHLLYVSYSGYQWNPDIQDRFNKIKKQTFISAISLTAWLNQTEQQWESHFWVSVHLTYHLNHSKLTHLSFEVSRNPNLHKLTNFTFSLPLTDKSILVAF